jgi:hypothetical protein
MVAVISQRALRAVQLAGAWFTVVSDQIPQVQFEDAL